MIAHNTTLPGEKNESLLRRLNPMRALEYIAAKGATFRQLVNGARRRQGWFVEQLTFRRALNMSMAGFQYMFKAERMLAYPTVVKIDISPMCNLSCTVCVHADPNGDPLLEKQEFHPQHRMSVEQFRKIINEIRGRSSAVSLYYVGDPLVHPDMDEMCEIARDAKLNVHISTNFSFALTDARIRRMVKSGLTHLTVCVDGLSQEKYQLTRVGGRIDRVINNLKRVCQFRNEIGQIYPKVEVQYIKFQHNVDELEPARKIMNEVGVDQFTDFWGDLGNYTDRDPELLQIKGPRPNQGMPQCYWPHGSMVIKYNGDVIPCCTYRIGHQYNEGDDPRVFGNVFRTSVREVWNNEKFRQARRMVNNPEVINSEPDLKNHFCYGCGAIFENSDATQYGIASVAKWEDRFELGPDGRPRAKSTYSTLQSKVISQIGLPSGQTATL